MKNLSEFKKSFDRDLAAFFNTRLRTYRRLGSGSLVPQYIDQTKTIALSGGKRIRPYLATLAFETFGGRGEKIIREVGLGLELFHLFALAHDDIVDKGMQRHGKATAHVFATELLLRHKRLGDVRHVGQSQGMLAGDLLLVWAEELLVGYGDVPLGRKLALESFRQTADELFVGEMIDIDLTTQKTTTLAAVKKKNILKTARYTFVGPMRIGARLATAKTKHDVFLEQFGEELGLAFQLQDDLLDVHGGGAGKDLLLDVAGRQHTYLTYFMFKIAAPKFRQQFSKMFGADTKTLRAEDVQDLYARSGAVAFVEREAKKSFAAARRLLSAGPVPKGFVQEWRDLVDLVERRTH
jgi:geranylgeranyl diphosphate synthase type I